MASRPIDNLSAEGRAVLSLVLLQSRSYGDIASLLRLSEDDVRQRAHAAAGQLLPGEGGPSAETRARIIDYLLGEQTVSARARTRSELQSSDVARKWAAELAQALAPLAKSPLPSIPGPELNPPPEPVTPARPIKRTEPAQPAVLKAPTPLAPPARRKAPHLSPVDQRPITQPRPDFAAPPRMPLHSEVPRRRLIATAAIALAAIIALVIVLAASGGGSKPRTSTLPPPPTTTQRGGRAQAARTIQRLVLQAAGANHNAFGAGAVVRQKDGSLLLLVQARGLVPNSAHNAYAVWLVNTPTDARLLGFVKPAVGAGGTFSSGTTLPSDAFRFHSLLVTIERSSQPSSPGPVVLRSPLSLP